MSTAPAHALTASPRRRLARAVMATGSVAAVLLSMGPLALVRAGVVVAVLTAIVACVAAWREVADVRRRAALLAGRGLRRIRTDRRTLRPASTGGPARWADVVGLSGSAGRA